VVPYASQGNILLASYLILLGSFLDLCDGWYARLTKTGNAFGKEFDLIADLVIFSMAPGFLLYFVYRDFNPFIAMILGLFPLLFGCLRLARFNVKSIEYPGYFVGVTRPLSAVAIVGFVNSSLIVDFKFWVAGIFFVVFISLMNVSFMPYIGHHKRTFTSIQKGVMALLALLLIGSLFIGRLWDIIFAIGLLYLLSPWFMVPKADKEKFYQFVAEWKAD